MFDERRDCARVVVRLGRREGRRIALHAESGVWYGDGRVGERVLHTPIGNDDRVGGLTDIREAAALARKGIPAALVRWRYSLIP